MKSRESKELQPVDPPNYLLASLMLLEKNNLGIKHQQFFCCKFINHSEKIYFILNTLDKHKLLNRKNSNLVFKHLFEKTGILTVLALLKVHKLLNQENFNILFYEPERIPQMAYALTCLAPKNLLNKSNYRKLFLLSDQLTDINMFLSNHLESLNKKKWQYIVEKERTKKLFIKGYNDKKSTLHRFFAHKKTKIELLATDRKYITEKIFQFI